MVSLIDYTHIPALDPSQGITANFINPQTIACSVLEVSLPLSIISTAFVVLRIYTRRRIVKSLGWDDLFIGLGTISIFSWIFCALEIIKIHYGYGVDVWNLYTTIAINFQKLELASQATYHLALLCAKISILFTQLRLNTNASPSPTFRILVFMIMAFTAIYSNTSLLIAIFGCSPIAAAWDIRIENVKCVDKAAYPYVYGACNICSSWAIFVLGLIVCLKRGLLGSRAGKAAKWCTGVVIVVGCFVSLASVIRLVISVPYLHSENFTHFKVYIARWCEIELTSTLILASLLALHPFLTTILPSYFPAHSTSITFPEIETPCQTPSRTRKMSEATSTTSNPTTSTCTSMSRYTSRQDVSLEESEIGLGGIVMEERIALGERRVLGGSVGKKGPVVKTIVYDVQYEA